jgi:DNA invertase Pin-like site-specific DNA recombinase
MKAMTRKTNEAKTGAAAYIRMSGRLQDKSPKEQRAEITKLAAGEGLRVVEWFTDEAITGDSSTDDRPGLAALLAGAKAGKFKVVLAWHTNRISREDPMDAIVFYNQLRKAGVGVHTCQEGAIDLEDFPKQLLLFVNQKASNDYLTELSAKTLRGKIAGAKTGARNGGFAPYGMDRGEFDGSGRLVRRLVPGDRAAKDNHVRLLPCADGRKLDALRYAFRRADESHLSSRKLAHELQAMGYPAPGLSGWTRNHVQRLLTNCAYAGMGRFGVRAAGVYYQAHGEKIVPCGKTKPKFKGRPKPIEETITVEAAHEPVIPRELFDRVYRKAKPAGGSQRRTENNRYPLSGLLLCSHCGRRLVAATANVRKTKGGGFYTYQWYVCGSYFYFGRDGFNNRTCGRHCVNSGRALDWLLYKLKEIYLGPAREALLHKIAGKLKERSQAGPDDVERLQRRIQELDREIGRLVAGIRTTDAPELAQELAAVKKERESVTGEWQRAKKPTTRTAPQGEPEKIAHQLRANPARLIDADPALLREVIRRFVTKIECRWGSEPGKRRIVHRLLEARIALYTMARKLPASKPANDCPADIAGGLVTFHVLSEPAPADCAEALADLLISAWEKRRGPKGGPRKQAGGAARHRRQDGDHSALGA